MSAPAASASSWSRLYLWAALAASAGLLASSIAGAAGAVGGDASFTPSGLVPIGPSPCSVKIANLNGDGSPDLAVANCGSGNVTILLGDGAGGFRPAAASPLAVGQHPGSIAVSDFNGDATMDLAVANGGSSDVTILLGGGGGGFSAAPGSPINVAESPVAVLAADANGDGHIDVLVTSRQGGRNLVTLLLADSSGRFAAASASPVALGNRTLVAVADFNADARPDLVAADYDNCRVSILPGDGAGGFGSATVLRACFLAVADFNRDGKPDLAVAKIAADSVTLRARVLLGNGAGGFRPAAGPPIAIGGADSSIATVADLDGDHRLDLAVANGSGAVIVLLGNGAGGFRQAGDSPFPVAESLYGIAAADLNGDGKPDLVIPAHVAKGEGLTIFWQTQSTPAVVSGGALPGRRDDVFSTRGLITKLATDGNRVAAMTTGIRRACGRVVVWTAPGRKSTSFKTEEGCPGDDSTIPARVDELALGGGQVAWITEAGGSTLELAVKMAKLSGGAAKQIASADNGYGAGGDPGGQWVGQLLGAGPLLAYNSWNAVCNHRHPDQGYCEGWGVAGENLVRIAGGRRAIVKRGAGACRLVAAGGGRMAVAGSTPWWDAGAVTCSQGAVDSAGVVSVLATSGSPLATIAPVAGNPPRAVALSRTHLAVERTFTIDLFDPATGAETKSLPLGPAAALRLASVNSQLALLLGPRRLVLVRLSDGKLISLAPRLGPAMTFCGPGCQRLTTSAVDPRLTEAGLFYAYNIPGAAAKGRIIFEPTRKLLTRF